MKLLIRPQNLDSDKPYVLVWYSMYNDFASQFRNLIDFGSRCKVGSQYGISARYVKDAQCHCWQLRCPWYSEHYGVPSNHCPHSWHERPQCNLGYWVYICSYPRDNLSQVLEGILSTELTLSTAWKYSWMTQKPKVCWICAVYRLMFWSRLSLLSSTGTSSSLSSKYSSLIVFFERALHVIGWLWGDHERY